MEPSNENWLSFDRAIRMLAAYRRQKLELIADGHLAEHQAGEHIHVYAIAMSDACGLSDETLLAQVLQMEDQ
jgi:hypothetical protein